MRNVLMRENNNFYQKQAINAKIEQLGLANLGLMELSSSQNANNTTKATALSKRDIILTNHLAQRSARKKQDSEATDFGSPHY